MIENAKQGKPVALEALVQHLSNPNTSDNSKKLSELIIDQKRKKIVHQ